MPRPLTREEGLKLAKHIIKIWEAIPDQAKNLACTAHHAGDLRELQRTLERSMRDMVGGKEVYEAAKQVVLELSEET